jgi:hypothetical protein
MKHKGETLLVKDITDVLLGHLVPVGSLHLQDPLSGAGNKDILSVLRVLDAF